MDIYEAIETRRTVRTFKDQKIEAGLLKKILSAGLRAPTNDHMRSWEFIVLEDQAARMKLLELIREGRTEQDAEKVVNQWGLVDPFQREMYLEAIPRQHQMLLKAGSLILPCFRQVKPLLQPVNLSALNGLVSIWCCIENILLAAAAEGIFGVTRIPSEPELRHMKTILNIPADYEIPCYLALGYPDEKTVPIRQHRIKVEERIHFNKW